MIPWVVVHAFAVLPAVSVALRQLLQAAFGDGSLSSHFLSRKPIFSPIGLAHFFIFITTSLRPSSPKTTMNRGYPSNVAHPPNVAEPEQVQQRGTQIEGEEIAHSGPSVMYTCWSLFKVAVSKVMVSVSLCLVFILINIIFRVAMARGSVRGR